jgi:hypothetical protein
VAGERFVLSESYTTIVGTILILLGTELYLKNKKEFESDRARLAAARPRA